MTWTDPVTIGDSNVMVNAADEDPQVGGTVFVDANGDGVQDDGESGLEDVPVALINSSGDTVATTTTSATGAYAFAFEAAGKYTVSFTAPSGYLFDGSGTGTWSMSVDASSGPAVANAGAYQPATLSGTAYVDLNDDMNDDPGDPGLSGVDVEVLNAAGAELGSTTTAADGSYLISGLPPGSVTAQFVVPSGYVVDGSSDTLTESIDLYSGQETPLDVPVYVSSQETSVSGNAWVEPDASGVMSPLAGVGVTLTDAGGDQVGSTDTSSSGAYSIGSLDPGTYTITFTAPSGYVFADSGLSTWSEPVALPGPNAVVDVGAIQPASASGTIFLDANDDGVQDDGESGLAGATVSLLDLDQDPVTDASGNAIASITTTSNGSYSFGNVLPGSYILQFVVPFGYVVDGTSNTWQDTITLSNGQALSVNAPAYTSTQDVSVTGTVFVDVNNDGTDDPGDPGLAGVGVVIENSSGTQVGSATTNSSGDYSVSGLQPGTYSAVFTAPSGYAMEASGTSTCTASVTTPGASSTQNEPAVQLGTVSGSAWVDMSGDGNDDPGDPALAGVTFALYDDYGYEAGSATTNSSGVYTIPNVEPGTYTEVVTPPSGYTADEPSITVTIAAGATTTSSAGAYQPGGVSGTVYVDPTASGQYQSGDATLAGATMTLYNSYGSVAGSGTTNSSGLFTISGLTPGSYTLSAVMPSGYAFETIVGSTSNAVAVTSGTTTTTNVLADEKVATTTMLTTTAPNPVPYGQAISLTATVSAANGQVPSGLVDFGVGSDILTSAYLDASGQAKWTFAPPPTMNGQTFYGPIKIWASYLGSGNLAGSTTTITLVIAPPATTVTLTANPTTISPSQPVTLTATVTVVAPGAGTPSTGTVQFNTGTTVLGYGVVNNGVATLTTNALDLPGVNYYITATYLGSSSYSQSPTSPEVKVTVTNTATVQGEVWEDSNANGMIDNGEPGENGITVELIQEDAFISSTTTNANGYYSFSVPQGNYYYIKVILPSDSGLAFTLEYTNGGVNDSDVNPSSGQSQGYTAVAGQVQTINVGLVPISSVGAILGPGVVPGNSQYTYSFEQQGNAPIYADWELYTSQGQYIQPNTPNGPDYSSGGNGLANSTASSTTIQSVTLTFPNTPMDLILKVEENGAVVAQEEILVIQVTVTTPASVTINDQKLPPFSTMGPLGSLVQLGSGAAALQSTAGIIWNASVSLSGPKGNVGINEISVGFIQHVTFTNVTGTYINSSTNWLVIPSILTNSSQGTTYIDGDGLSAWFTQGLTPQGVPSLIQNQPAAGTFALMDEDQPYFNIPLSFQQATMPAILANSSAYNLLGTTSELDLFQLDVDANTADSSNGAGNSYWGQAGLAWAFNGSGKLTAIGIPPTVQWIPMDHINVMIPSSNMQLTNLTVAPGTSVLTNGWIPLTLYSETTAGPFANNVSNSFIPN